MKRYSIPILISLLIHFFLAVLLFLFLRVYIFTGKSVYIVFEIEETAQNRDPVIQESPDIRREKQKEISPESEKIPIPFMDQQQLISVKEPSWADVVQKAKQKAEGRTSKISQTIQTVTPFQSLVFDPNAPKNDIVADQIRKQELGMLPLLFKPTMQPEGSVMNPVQFDFIPSEAQLQSLNQLFDKGEASQLELYPNLTLSKQITAEDFDESLDMLVKKGFVSRKKISPQNILYVQSIPIELSPKNHRNPVFSYRVNVKRIHMITYLQATLQQYREKQILSAADSTELQTQIEDLNSKIQILIRH
jgi:hypothetical protein